MNIVIAAQGIKRELDGPFEVCLRRKDMERIHSILADKLRTDDGRSEFYFGWVRIDDAVDSPSNTPPRKWSE